MLHNGLMSGAEPFYFAGDDTGCLLIHGFTSSPQEIRWLGQHLAAQGYSVCGVRLAGHGTRLSDMGRSYWRDWYASVLDGYHLLRQNCTRLYALGLSLGGSLALYLAANEPLDGVVAMATPFRLSGPRIRLARLLQKVIYSVPKRNGDNLSEHIAQVQTRRGETVTGRVSYPARPLVSVIQLSLFLDEVRRALPKVNIPLLMAHARHDDFIPIEHMQRIFDMVSSDDKTVLILENGSHVVTEDSDRKMLFARVTDFIATQNT